MIVIAQDDRVAMAKQLARGDCRICSCFKVMIASCVSLNFQLFCLICLAQKGCFRAVCCGKECIYNLQQLLRAVFFLLLSEYKTTQSKTIITMIRISESTCVVFVTLILCTTQMFYISSVYFAYKTTSKMSFYHKPPVSIPKSTLCMKQSHEYTNVSQVLELIGRMRDMNIYYGSLSCLERALNGYECFSGFLRCGNSTEHIYAQIPCESLIKVRYFYIRGKICREYEFKVDNIDVSANRKRKLLKITELRLVYSMNEVSELTYEVDNTGEMHDDNDVMFDNETYRIQGFNSFHLRLSIRRITVTRLETPFDTHCSKYSDYILKTRRSCLNECFNSKTRLSFGIVSTNERIYCEAHEHSLLRVLHENSPSQPERNQTLTSLPFIRSSFKFF